MDVDKALEYGISATANRAVRAHSKEVSDPNNEAISQEVAEAIGYRCEKFAAFDDVYGGMKAWHLTNPEGEIIGSNLTEQEAWTNAPGYSTDATAIFSAVRGSGFHISDAGLCGSENDQYVAIAHNERGGDYCCSDNDPHYAFERALCKAFIRALNTKEARNV